MDPLVGGPPIRPAAQLAAPTPAATPTAAVTPTAATGPAPVPAPSTSTSPAALAPGSFQPLDPNHDLRIGGAGRPTSGGEPWHGQSGPGGVALSRPEGTSPAPPPRQDAPPVTGYPVPTAAAPVLTFEQAEAQLRQRGVTWQRLESASGGEWKFSCSVPDRQNPNIGQTYEGRAQDQIGAMRAVLDQIDRDQR